MWELRYKEKDILHEGISVLPGVGPKRVSLFEELGIKTVADMLECVPIRYIHRKTAVQIADVISGDDATIFGTISSSSYRAKKLFLEVEDESGKAQVIFFNPPHYFQKDLKKGRPVLIWGKSKIIKGKLNFTHPNIEIEGKDREILIPIYPNATRLRECKIGYRTRMKIIGSALERIAALDDPLSGEILADNDLMPFIKAISTIHLPVSWEELASANRRLAFDEILIQQIIFAKRKHESAEDASSIPLKPGKLFYAAKASLGFELTQGQNIALSGLMSRATKGGRSQQLLSGDVASGKTVIALLMAAATIDSGLQVAFMVPSTLLAGQHAEFFYNILGSHGVRVGLLTGSSTSILLENKLSKGEVDIVIGTQALLSKKRKFKKLGLIIIDEQHRFGVNQRINLSNKQGAHVLLMTATPIPRTSALASYGDLDLQVLEGFPKDRAGFKTYIRDEISRSAIWDFIEMRIKNDERAYIVFPRIDGDGFNALNSAYNEIENRFPEKTSKIFGAVSDNEKNRIFNSFKLGEKPILVSTNVIEVGVDVPLATIMVIENPELFGLAQLHQLRGRIGRGQKPGFCILLVRSSINSKQRNKLELFSETGDGFQIAELDLEFRGEGNVFDIMQSGMPIYDFAEPLKMKDLLEIARQIAQNIIIRDPNLQKKQNIKYRKAIECLCKRRNMIKLPV
ncbi:ATP-dependent DNA helicase RecG [bacterium]|nr:ATP-dependent DNA helicase RecG [bacterium]